MEAGKRRCELEQRSGLTNLSCPHFGQTNVWGVNIAAMQTNKSTLLFLSVFFLRLISLHRLMFLSVIEILTLFILSSPPHASPDRTAMAGMIQTSDFSLKKMEN